MNIIIRRTFLLLLGGAVFLSGVAWAQTSDGQDRAREQQRLLLDRLYNRALNIGETDYTRLSERTHLLWMAYLVDSSNAAVLSELGKVYGTWLNQPEAGLSFLKEAFVNSDYDYYVGMDLFMLAVQQKEWEVAEQVAVKLLEERPDNLYLHMTLVSIYEESGELERALNAVNRLRVRDERSRNNISFVSKETELLQKLGRTREAEEILSVYMQENPNDLSPIILFVLLYIEDNNYDRANEILDRELQRFPESLHLVELAVASYAWVERYDDVAEQILRGAQLEGTAPEEVNRLIELAKRMAPSKTEVMTRLVPVQRELLTLFPETDQLAIELANDLFVLRDTLQGEEVLRSLVERGTSAQSPYYYFVQKHASVEDTLQLRSVVHHGLETLPDDGLLNYYSCLLELQAGDTITFVQRLDHALEIVPDTDPIYSHLALFKAEAEMWDDDWEGAKQYYEIASSTPNELAYNNYAYSLAIHGTREDLNKAEDLARKAVQLAPDRATYLDTYAWVLYLKEAYPLARIYMEKAIENMEEPDALYYEHYAEILTKLESYEQATEAWGQVLLLGDEEEQAKAREKMSELEKILEEE